MKVWDRVMGVILAPLRVRVELMPKLEPVSVMIVPPLVGAIAGVTAVIDGGE